MGIVSFILVKLLYRAKPFQSESLDRLAQEMGVKNSRYYTIRGNPQVCTGLYDGSLVFDKKYFDMLTPDEVLAIGAHEFNHILKKHVQRRAYRILLPSLMVLFLAGYIVGINPSLNQLMGYGVFIGLATVFSFLFAFIASQYLNASWLRGQETECDLSAVEVGHGEAMITALRKIRIRFPLSSWNAKLSRLAPRTYPSIDQRVETIRKAIDITNSK